MNEAVTIRGEMRQMCTYVESQVNGRFELPVAVLRASYSDTLGHPSVSAPDPGFVNMVQVTDAWQLRNLRPAVPASRIPVWREGSVRQASLMTA